MTDHEATAKRIVEDWVNECGYVFMMGQYDKSGLLQKAIAAALAESTNHVGEFVRGLTWTQRKAWFYADMPKRFDDAIAAEIAKAGK